MEQCLLDYRDGQDIHKLKQDCACSNERKEESPCLRIYRDWQDILLIIIVIYGFKPTMEY